MTPQGILGIISVVTFGVCLGIVYWPRKVVEPRRNDDAPPIPTVPTRRVRDR